MIVRLFSQVFVLPPKRMCLLCSSQPLFDSMKQPPLVSHFLFLFQTFLCQHDVHDFLWLDVGVVWCFKYRDVPSVGRVKVSL